MNNIKIVTINKSKYLLLVLFIGIISFFIYKNTYTEFEPTILEGNSYRKIEVNSMFFINLKFVLDYYNVKFKMDDRGKVLVKRNLSVDKESLFNYTKKALDAKWLNSKKELK